MKKSSSSPSRHQQQQQSQTWWWPFSGGKSRIYVTPADAARSSNHARASRRGSAEVKYFLRNVRNVPTFRRLDKAKDERYLSASHLTGYMTEEQKNNIKKSLIGGWIIIPRSTWKIRWDLYIGFIILYSVILIPYRIGFGIELAAWERYMNYFFDASFGMDIAFNFLTGYYEGEMLIFDWLKIRNRYLSSWFVFDFLSSAPIDQFVEAMTGTSSSLLSLKLFRTIRLFRLLKLMRLMRLKRTFEVFEMSPLNAHLFQTIKSLVGIIFIIHLISCGWYMFYTLDPDGNNWVNALIKKTQREMTSPYLVSFYWVSGTMMSVGYGDIVGVTDGERIFSIFVQCLGSICVGLIIANIQMLTENYNPRALRLKQRLQEAKEFLSNRSIPRRMRHRIISQFEYHWSRRSVFDEENLLTQFPKSLQYEMLTASMEHFLVKFPFFAIVSVDFFIEIIPLLRPIILSPQQPLVQAESVWEEIYFIMFGSLEALQGNIIAGTLQDGDICGIEYLNSERKRYSHTYRSSTKVELYALRTVDLLKAMKNCDIAKRFLTDLSTILAEKYVEAANRGRKTMLNHQLTLKRDFESRLLNHTTPSNGNGADTGTNAGANAGANANANAGGGCYMTPPSNQPVSNGRGILHRKSSYQQSIGSQKPSEFSSGMNRRRSTLTAALFEVQQRLSFHLGAVEESKIHWSILHHYSKFRMTWDVLLGFLVAFTAISIPFRICFEIPDTLFEVDRISDALFLVDIVLNFVTTYLDDTGLEIVDRHEIQSHYLKTSFLVDIVSAIPFDFLVESAFENSDNQYRSLKLFRTLKLVKLLRLMRLSKLLKLSTLTESEFEINPDMLRLFKLIFPVLTIAHYVGCFWYYITADEPQNETWRENINLDESTSIMTRYIASLYWATTTMATVGYGDIYAVSDGEKGYSTFVMIGGATIFAYVIGTVIEIVSHSKSLGNRENEMTQKIIAYVKERGVSHEFVVACREHLRFIDLEKTFFKQGDLFEALSYNLRSDLILLLNAHVLERFRCFDKKPKWFLTFVLPHLKPQYFLAGDLIVYHGNKVEGIYFLYDGLVIARTPSTLKVNVTSTNSMESKQREASGPVGSPKNNTMKTGKSRLGSFSRSFASKTQVPILGSQLGNHIGRHSTRGSSTSPPPRFGFVKRLASLANIETEEEPDSGAKKIVASIRKGDFFAYKEVFGRQLAEYNLLAAKPSGTYLLPREFFEELEETLPSVGKEIRKRFLHSIQRQQKLAKYWNNEVLGYTEEEEDEVDLEKEEVIRLKHTTAVLNSRVASGGLKYPLSGEVHDHVTMDMARYYETEPSDMISGPNATAAKEAEAATTITSFSPDT